MKKRLSFSPLTGTASAATLLLLVATTAMTACSNDKSDSADGTMTNPQVVFETTAGDFTVELYSDKAPKTVENFLAYVEKGLYEDTIFHRVIKGFVIQGGGFNKEMQHIETLDNIENEANNGLSNALGTIAMARTNDPHSASSQFFVNLNNNAPLDHKDESSTGWGYCVFGKVTDGMKTVQKIGEVETVTIGPFQDVPKEPITLTEISLK